MLVCNPDTLFLFIITVLTLDEGCEHRASKRQHVGTFMLTPPPPPPASYLILPPPHHTSYFPPPLNAEIVQGNETIFYPDNDSSKYNKLFASFDTVSPLSYYFTDMSKFTFIVVNKFLRSGPFRGRSDMFSNLITAFLITKSPVEYLIKKFRRVQVIGFGAKVEGIRALITTAMVGEDRSIVENIRGDVEGHVATLRESSRYPIVREMDGTVLDFTCNVEKAITVEHPSVGLLFKQRTVDAMSFASQHGNQMRLDFTDVFEAEFGKEHYPFAVLAGAMTSGSIAFMGGRFHDPDWTNFALSPFAIFGIASCWLNHKNLNEPREGAVVFPPPLMGERSIMVTLYTLAKMHHEDNTGSSRRIVFYHAIMGVILRLSDMRFKSMQFRVYSMKCLLSVMDSAHFDRLLPSVKHDSVLMELLTLDVLKKRSIIYIWEAVLVKTNTIESLAARARLLFTVISDDQYPVERLNGISTEPGQRNGLVQIWKNILKMKDPDTGELVAFQDLTRYSERFKVMVSLVVETNKTFRRMIAKDLLNALRLSVREQESIRH